MQHRLLNRAKPTALAIAAPRQGISPAQAFLLAIIVYFAFSSLAMAACFQSNDITPMGMVLCRVVDFMYGNLGRGLATLGIITLGIGALLGKVTWGMALTVGIGISVIFNAEAIVSLLLCGNSGERICP
jgi:type IV secretory pathway VirB2 component (pilin)